MIPYNVYDVEIPDNLNDDEVKILIIDYLYSILAGSNILENIEYITDFPEWILSDWELTKGFTFEYKSFQYCIYAAEDTNLGIHYIDFALKNFEEVYIDSFAHDCSFTNATVEFGIAISNDYFILVSTTNLPDIMWYEYLTIKVDEPINSNDTDLYIFKHNSFNYIIYNKSFNNESYLDSDSKTKLLEEVDTFILKGKYLPLYTKNFYNNKYCIHKIYTASTNFGIRGKISKMLSIYPLRLLCLNIYKINDDKYLCVDGFLLKIDTELEAENLDADTFFLSSSSSSPPPPTNKKDFQNGLIVGMTIGKDF